MIWPCAKRIDEEDETVAVVERSQNLRHLLQLRRRRHLRLPNSTTIHVSADRNDDDFAVWEDGDVIVDVIGNMANLGATNDINSHSRIILDHAHDAVAEEEDAFWSWWSVEVAAPSVAVVALLPSWALSVLVGVATSPAVKRLLPVLYLKAVLYAIVARPCVESANVIGAQLHLCLSYSVQDAICIPVSAADSGLDDDSPVGTQEVVKKLVADESHFTFL